MTTILDRPAMHGVRRQFLSIDPPIAPSPVEIVRDPDAGPAVPERVLTGGDLWNAISASFSWRFNHSPPTNEEEAESLASATQAISDWAELASGLQPAEAVRAGFALGQIVDELTGLGFAVYVARERRLVTGGGGPPSPWGHTDIWLVRKPPGIDSAERGPAQAAP